MGRGSDKCRLQARFWTHKTHSILHQPHPLSSYKVSFVSILQNHNGVTVRSRYIAVIFLRTTHESTPYLAHKGEVWGVDRECKSDRSFVILNVVFSALYYHIQPRCILKVYSTRKLDCTFLFSANRLTGVTVKASGQTPPLEDVTALDGTGFTLCGMYTKVTKPAEIVSIACAPRVSGRYVYVHLSSKNFLQICEVEVYGDRKYTIYSQIILYWRHL